MASMTGPPSGAAFGTDTLGWFGVVGALGGFGCCVSGTVSNGLRAGGVAGRCWEGAGGCEGAVCARKDERLSAQKQAEITAKRARQRNFMQAYLSTLRKFGNVGVRESFSR